MAVNLSKREIKVLLLLLELDHAITTKKLADMHDVSVRTIKYDLENIRQWFVEQNVSLHSRRNKGIWLDIPDSQRLTLKNEVMNVDRFEIYPDQELRINQLIFQLLLAKTYVTAQELADQLQVSRNTVVSDLNYVEEIVKKYELTLQRQTGQGFSVSGSESNSRLLMEYVNQKAITEYDIYQIMRQFVRNEQREGIREIQLGVTATFQPIYQVTVKEMAALLDRSLLDQFNYAEILSITLRVSIAVSRMQLNHTIGSYKTVADSNTLIEKQELAFLLMQKVFNHYELPLLSDEYLYIYSDVFISGDRQNIVHLTEELIQAVSKKINFPFYRDKQLFTNLFAHLSLRLTKKHRFINEYNPFVDDIKERYEQLFVAIHLACKNKRLQHSLLINDSFVAYIALHFLVTYEKNIQETNIVRIVYVCSTGLGVTSLIEQKIMEEVSNVEIAAFASVLNADKIISEKNPDLILSIFPIEVVNCPFIKVNPLPTETDINNIQEEVNKLLLNTKARSSVTPVSRQALKPVQSIERESRDIIMQGYTVYEKLLKVFADYLENEYQEAFLLHVLLMVHRIRFNNQYEDLGHLNNETLTTYRCVIEQTENVFAENDLAVNQAEIIALLNYIKEK